MSSRARARGRNVGHYRPCARALQVAGVKIPCLTTFRRGPVQSPETHFVVGLGCYIFRSTSQSGPPKHVQRTTWHFTTSVCFSRMDTGCKHGDNDSPESAPPRRQPQHRSFGRDPEGARDVSCFQAGQRPFAGARGVGIPRAAGQRCQVRVGRRL